MTLKNVRERTASIGKLGRTLAGQAKVLDPVLLEQAIRFLISQLKVNFRPLYAETIGALAGMADSSGEVLWKVLWKELQRTTSADVSHAPDLDWVQPTWATSHSQPETQQDNMDEEDVEFRCPNANKGRRALSNAWEASQDHTVLDRKEIVVSLCIYHENQGNVAC